MQAKGRVLIVDDDPFHGGGFRDILKDHDYECEWVTKPQMALNVVHRKDFDLVMVDWDLGRGEMNGQELNDQLLELRPDLEIQLFTAKNHAADIPTTIPRFPMEKGGDFETDKFLNAILQGINAGLRKKLLWQQEVIESSGVKYMVLNDGEQVVWDSEPTNSRFNTEGLPWQQAMSKLGLHTDQSVRPLKDHSDNASDALEFQDGTWREFNFRHFNLNHQEAHRTSYSVVTSTDCTNRVLANRLIHDLVQLERFDEIANRLCEGCIELGYRRSRLWIRRGDGKTFRLVKWKGFRPATTRRELDISLPDDTREQAFDFIHCGVTIAKREQLDLDGQYGGVLSVLGLEHCREWLAIPLKVRGELIGLFALDMLECNDDGTFRQERDLSARDILLGETISGFAAAALDRGMSNTNFECVVRMLETVTNEGKIGATLHKIVHAAMNEPWMLDADGADIAVRDSKNTANSEFERVFMMPSVPSFPKKLNINIGPFAKLARRRPATMRPYFIPNIHDDDSVGDQIARLNQTATMQQFAHYLEDIRGMVIVPLLDVEGALLGFLSLHYANPIQVTPRYERWLRLLAGICARVLEIREQNNALAKLITSLEDQVINLGSLSTFGEMTAGIAHEIKHYFQRILNGTELARHHSQSGKAQEAVAAIRNIEDQTRAANQYLDTIKRVFSGLHDGTPETTVELAISNALDIAQGDIKRVCASVTKELAPNLPRIPWTTGISLLVFGNLLKNACDALAAQDQEMPRIIKLTARRDPKLANHVLITIEDNGVGIDDEHLDRIFVPGFSTKIRDETKGLGMGLSLVKRILEKTTGSIWANSTKGIGTTFFVSVPEAKLNRQIIEVQSDEPARL